MYSLNLIIHELRTRISAHTLRFLIRHNMLKATELLILFNIKKLQKTEIQGSDSINILFLPKGGFNEDLTASFGGSGEYGLYSLGRELVKTVYSEFLPIEIDDNNYLTDDPQIESQKIENIAR